MNKSTFTKYINELKKFNDDGEKFGECMENFLDGHFVVKYGDHLIQAYIELLAKIMSDKNKWIEWFVYENNFGENEFKVYSSQSDKVGKKIKSAGDLYDVLNNKP